MIAASANLSVENTISSLIVDFVGASRSQEVVAKVAANMNEKYIDFFIFAIIK